MLLGHMIQGDWIEDDGNTVMEVSVYFDLLRLWDSRAVWHKMESDPAALMANIRYAQRVGAKVLFTFGEPPASALLAGYAKVPTMDAWKAFVARIAATPGVDVLEGLNEPMYPQYWDGTPELLAEYQRALYKTAKRIAPEKPVLSPSFVRVELPDGQEYIRRFKAAGGLKWCDGFAWHGYAGKAADLRGQHGSIRTFTNLPLWNTEFVIGARFERQAVTDAFLLMNGLGVECGVYNPEPAGYEDYTDSTMQLVHAQLAALSNKGGCLPRCFQRFVS